jgi:SAM-dependent methyltransferase
MKGLVQKSLDRLRRLKSRLSPGGDSGGDPLPAGVEGVRSLGHRKYVGGKWEQLGRLQFAFLLQEGLRPDDRLVDVGCGSLRAGVYLIPYLKAGHYMGIDQEALLIRRGIEDELGRELYDAKRPEFVVSSSFEFEKFCGRPDFGIAQSLFTHLSRPDIERCLGRLRTVIRPNGRFYASFFEVDEPVANPDGSHPHRRYEYTASEMRTLARETGWEMTRVGDWHHPRDQKMLMFRPA